MNEGGDHALRSLAQPTFIQNADPGISAPGTLRPETIPTLEQYENIFGPAARDIKFDNQRNKRHQRWHLPDALKGANQYLTDRVDGLITDATNSPFTRNILPYVYLENPDQKLKWNVYSFDEGMASRVPYESAARVLPQTKRSFAGYVVRQGLAIAMEHNFMVSEAGRLNFKRQLMQLVGSIQLTNDLDVHVALITAPSYQKHMDEKYMDSTRTFAHVCREYSDLFGMMQKTTNALDFIIEDAKNHLKTWGSQPPTFILCNGALTTQLTMIPEKTNYLTNGPDGARRLAQGPELPSYRGLSIINTRKFSMEAGAVPRDLLRRRVRVCQHYYIPWSENVMKGLFEFYDEGKDSFFTKSWVSLFEDAMAFNQNGVAPAAAAAAAGGAGRVPAMAMNFDHAEAWARDRDGRWVKIDNTFIETGNYNGAGFAGVGHPAGIPGAGDGMNQLLLNIEAGLQALPNPHTREQLLNVFRVSTYRDRAADQGFSAFDALDPQSPIVFPQDILVLRPNIEHEMLGIIIGRGGTQELGATFWGQTELSCYDDAQHGIWGMSYKYHERAIVTNERNLIRLYDVSFAGYNGGMDDQTLDWNTLDQIARLSDSTLDVSKPFSDKSMLVMAFRPLGRPLPNPLLFSKTDDFPDRGKLAAFDIDNHSVQRIENLRECFEFYFGHVAPQLRAAFYIFREGGNAGGRALANESECFLTSYHGYLAHYIIDPNSGARTLINKTQGTGHLGQCFEGVASVRMGRGLQIQKGPAELRHLV